MSREQFILQKIDQHREAQGFHNITELLELAEQGNIFLDPFSILISKTVVLGEGNIFYPSVIVQATNAGELTIGDKNTFFPNTLILADRGKVKIGNGNQFGDGGCSIKANMPDADIQIGDDGRYLNGAVVIGRTVLGSGSQIIGAITAQDCELESGDSFKSGDPDERAGLLKGTGLARGIVVHKGEVLNGAGMFLQTDIEAQSAYHPKP